MALTYEPIATTTLGSANASITFSSIPSTYTDLRVVLVATSTLANDPYFTINSDNNPNYSTTGLAGDGANASSSSTSSAQNFGVPGGRKPNANVPYMFEIDIFSYAGSTKKTCLYTVSMDKNGSGSVSKVVGLWNSTSAINSITLGVGSSTFASGTTATLYGIKSA